MKYVDLIPYQAPSEGSVNSRYALVQPLRYEISDGGKENAPALAEYVWMLYRRKRLLILITGFGILLAAVVSMLQPTIYRSAASIEVQGFNDPFLNIRDIPPATVTAALPSEADVETHAEALRQDPLIEQVVKRLKLNQRPEFRNPSDPSPWLPAALSFHRQPQRDSVRQAAKIAKENLRITPSKGSRIIRITYGSSDPQLAATFANTLALAYIEQSVEARRSGSLQVRAWLAPQLQDVKHKLEQAQERLQGYSDATGLVVPSPTANPAEEKLRLLQAEFTKAQADRMTKEPHYTMTAGSGTDEIIESPTVRDYQTRLTDLRRQLAEQQSLFTPESYKVRRINAQVEELETALQKERSAQRQRIRAEYQAASKREELMSAALVRESQRVAKVANKMVEYNTLNREVETTRQVYEAMLRKMSEAEIASAVRPSNIRVIGQAQPAERPHTPNLPLNLSIGFFAGFSLAAACVTMLEQSKRHLAVPGDVEAHLNVPELGAIPGAKRASWLMAGRHGLSMEMVSWESKFSNLSESFRAAVASILVAARNGGPRVLVVTSSLPGEGKTTVTCNLGIALAEVERRVLLIDGDLRRPRLHQVFHQVNSTGLSTLLDGSDAVLDLPMEVLVRKTVVPNLFVLTSGPGTDCIFSLLRSPRASQLIDRFRKEFDHVLIDAPPSLEYADARTLALNADGVIMVVRAEHTDGKTALTAVKRFHMDGIPVVGAILNDWNPRGSHAYGYPGLNKLYQEGPGESKEASFVGPAA